MVSNHGGVFSGVHNEGEVRPESEGALGRFARFADRVAAFFATQIDDFVSARTFTRISTSVAVIAVVAVGQTLVMQDTSKPAGKAASKACLVIVAPPTVDLDGPEDLKQVKAFINDGSCGINIDLGTWHTAPLPLGPEVNLVNIQGEHSGEDIEERSFEDKFDTIIEVVL